MSTISLTHRNVVSAAGDLGVTRSNASRLFLAFATLLISVTFMTPFEESWTRSTTYDNFFNADHIEPTLAHGSGERQIALGAIGLLGFTAFALLQGKRLRVATLLGLLCLAYLAWCAASCLWSDDLGVSSRRYLALLCEVFAALAIAKHTTARQYVGMVFACTLIWLVLGVFCELVLGTFQPWQPGYRFAGVFHPNLMGVNCALLIMSALYLRGDVVRRNRLLLFTAAIAFVLLILTGSRTALVAMLAALVVGWLIVRSGPQRLLFTMTGAAAALCAAVVLALGMLDDTMNWLSMGRTDHDFTSLTGRLPLWQELVGYYVQQQPLLGYGYGGFWTEERILAVSHTQTWSVTHAHSTYIDFALNIGLIGGLICVLTMLVAFFVSVYREVRQPRCGYGFIAMIVAFALGGGVLESYIGTSWFLSFIGIWGVAYLLFADEQQPSPAAVYMRNKSARLGRHSTAAC